MLVSSILCISRPLDFICLGCDITFYAALAINHQIRLISLIPTLSCIQSASEGCDCKSMYQAFIVAALVLQAHILEDTKELQNSPTAPIILLHVCHYLAISKITKFRASSGSGNHLKCNFHCQFDSHHGQDHRCYLYIVDGLETSESLLIKFALQNVIDLHNFCAQDGHAPPILSYE